MKDAERDSLAQLTVIDFLGRVAGPQATPGGGSVAALAGALSACLVKMVGGLTIGRKGYEAVTETMTTTTDRAEKIAHALTLAVDQDADAYNGVMAAFALPKADDTQKAERAAAIQAAMKQAAEVPLGVADHCLSAAELALVALHSGNTNASSDAAVALLLALTALEGAALNVATNLDSIKDAAYVAAKKEALEPLFARAAELRAEMWTTAHQRISSLPGY